MLRHMQKDAATNGQTHARKGEFHKVGENLYRYSSNDRYYAVFPEMVLGSHVWTSSQYGRPVYTCRATPHERRPEVLAAALEEATRSVAG